MFDAAGSLYYVSFTSVATKGSTPIAFKAYLEKSEITFTPEDIQLPVSPAAATNDKQTIKLIHNVSFTIKVFSENLDEARKNYIKLKKLITSIKPRYRRFEGDLIPDINNIRGLLQVDFKGLPLSQRELKIHLQSFSYTINKELGYIETPKVSNDLDNTYLDNNSKDKLYVADGMELIPLGFDISIVGRINFSLGDTANIEDSEFRQAIPVAAAAAAAASTATPAAATSGNIIDIYLDTSLNYTPALRQKIIAVIDKNFPDLYSKFSALPTAVKDNIIITIRNALSGNKISPGPATGPFPQRVPIFKPDGSINQIDFNNTTHFPAGLPLNATDKTLYTNLFQNQITSTINNIKKSY